MKKCEPRLLTPYLDGELTEDGWAQITEHLQSCPTCGAQLDELTAATRQVKAMGRAEIPLTALKPALELISQSVGLSPEAAFTETTEIARAEPWIDPAENLVMEPQPELQPEVPEVEAAPEATAAALEAEAEDGSELGHAWSPGGTPTPPVPPAAVADETFWTEPIAPPTSPTSPPPAPLSEAATSPIHQPPTWVQPESWSPDPSSEPQPDESAGLAPPADETTDLVASDSPAIEPADDAEPDHAEETADHLEALTEHPSPPPPQISPSWMDATSAPDAELEEVGRRAVDEAIGAEAMGADTTDVDATGALPIGDEVAEKVIGGEVGHEQDSEVTGQPTMEPAPDTGEDLETPALVAEAPTDIPVEPHRPWLSSILGRANSEPAEATESEAIAPDAAEFGATESEPVEHIATDAVDGVPESSPEETPAEEVSLVAAPSEPAFPVGSWFAKAHDLAAPDDEAAVAPTADGDADAAPDEHAGVVGHYRDELLLAREQSASAGHSVLSLRKTQVRVGVAGVLLVVVAATAGILLASRTSHHAPSVATSTGHSASSPAPRPTAAASPAPSTVPSQSGAGQLTEVVSAGSGGSGWTVTRIRTGSPGNGITRLVFDFTSSGATPAAQLGRGSDGALYLSAPGISATAAQVAGMPPSGAIAGITQITGSGLNLRIATNGRPGFSIGYLSGPNRLVIDLK